MTFRRLVDLWIRARTPDDPLAPDSETGLAGAVVVTGGSDGIGLEMAECFAAAGHHVVLVARRVERLEAAQRHLRAQSAAHSVRTLALDVTRDDAPDVLEAWLTGQGLFCEILVNSAGIGVSGPFLEVDEARLETMLALNVRALTALTKRFLPAMAVRRWGGILNVASFAGLVAGPYQAPYYASKAYVISLTEALAWEMRGRGVRVSVVAPGPVNTRFHARMNAETAFYRQGPFSMAPERVARSAVTGFWLGRTLVIPGLTYNVLGFAIRFLPRKLVAATTGVFIKPRGARLHDGRQQS